VGDQWLWRMSKASGSGGVLGDIGCHILDLTCYVVGDLNSVFCRLKHFDKGYKNNTLRGYKLDANESAVINAQFANGAVGTIHMSRWATGHMNDLTLRVFGSKAGLALTLKLDQPWDALSICSGDDVDRCCWRQIACGKTPTVFESFIRSVRTGKNAEPTFTVGEKIQRYLEACLKSDKMSNPVYIINSSK
jgi:predicted dehydrogenase